MILLDKKRVVRIIASSSSDTRHDVTVWNSCNCQTTADRARQCGQPMDEASAHGNVVDLLN